MCGIIVSLVSLVSAPAAAVDLGLTALIGTGVDTGDAENNPYALQIGGAAELTVLGYVFGIRATRSVGTDADCGPGSCTIVKDLRSFGGDFGFDWEIALFHLSPRFGFGRLSERNGNLVAAYLEPGGVAEVELGLLALGLDVRYRVAIKESDASGLLAYARLGLRF